MESLENHEPETAEENDESIPALETISDQAPEENATPAETALPEAAETATSESNGNAEEIPEKSDPEIPIEKVEFEKVEFEKEEFEKVEFEKEEFEKVEFEKFDAEMLPEQMATPSPKKIKQPPVIPSEDEPVIYILCSLRKDNFVRKCSAINQVFSDMIMDPENSSTEKYREILKERGVIVDGQSKWDATKQMLPFKYALPHPPHQVKLIKKQIPKNCRKKYRKNVQKNFEKIPKKCSKNIGKMFKKNIEKMFKKYRKNVQKKKFEKIAQISKKFQNNRSKKCRKNCSKKCN